MSKLVEKYIGEGKRDDIAFDISKRKIKALDAEKKRLTVVTKRLASEASKLMKYLKTNMVVAIKTAWDREQLLEIEEYLSGVDTALDKLEW